MTTEERNEAFQEWLKDRPQIIKDLAKKYPPADYRLNGNVARLYSYSEDGTVTMLVLQELNPDKFIAMDRQVFGVNPADLQPL